MDVPSELYKDRRDEFIEKKINVSFIGRRDRLPKHTLEAIQAIERDTNEFTGFKVIIAFDYGSYEEITTAIKKIVKDVAKNDLTVDDLTEELIGEYLYTNGLPSIDFLVRTSGESRLSNYLLWQLAYSELYFPKTYWPDFNKNELLIAIQEFNKRQRRFGTITEE